MAWTKEKFREYSKEYSQARRKKHLCLSCGVKTDGGAYCDKCANKRCHQLLIAIEKRKIQGQCVQCNQKVEHGRTRCSSCLEQKNAYCKQRRDTWIRQGLCGQCGGKTSGKKSCESCLMRIRNWEKQRRASLTDAGLCHYCGKNYRMHYAVLCQVCYIKNKSRYHLKTVGYWQTLLALLESQDWKCPYTGEHLILGLNDSLDHKFPRAKFPDLASNITNLEWVTRDVNKMKADQTPDEFLALVQKIHDYRL